MGKTFKDKENWIKKQKGKETTKKIKSQKPKDNSWKFEMNPEALLFGGALPQE